MTDPDALRLLLADPTATIDQAMILVSGIDTRTPDVAESSSTLDELADGVALATAEETLQHVFGTLGFTGDQQQYYSPDNSLIHCVLKRRKGIPLSLAVVASEVARRHGLSMMPVGMPGHVLLTSHDAAGQQRWFDPFGGGKPLSDIVLRTLANLLNAYGRLGDLSQMISVGELQQAARPGPAINDRLLRMLEMAGRYEQAADLIERVHTTDSTSTESESSDVAGSLQRLRAHRN